MCRAGGEEDVSEAPEREGGVLLVRLVYYRRLGGTAHCSPGSGTSTCGARVLYQEVTLFNTSSPVSGVRATAVEKGLPVIAPKPCHTP